MAKKAKRDKKKAAAKVESLSERAQLLESIKCVSLVSITILIL